MIPESVDRWLQERRLPFEHTVHSRAVSAQRLAHAEHVTGDRLAKPVVVTLDGELALAVVAASQRVDLEVLKRMTGAKAVLLARESEFEGLFAPCEVGAEPALGLFGVPIYVDDDLTSEPWLLMRGGTHEDALRVETANWMNTEHPTPVAGLGRHRPW